MYKTRATRVKCACSSMWSGAKSASIFDNGSAQVSRAISPATWFRSLRVSFMYTHKHIHMHRRLRKNRTHIARNNICNNN